jgi:hypothetical protein
VSHRGQGYEVLWANAVSEYLKPGDRMTDICGTTVVVVDRYQKNQKYAWFISKSETAALYKGAYFKEMLYLTDADVAFNANYALCLLEEMDEESNEFGIVSP